MRQPILFSFSWGGSVIFFNLTQEEEKRQNTAYKNFIQNVIKDTNVLSQVMLFLKLNKNYIIIYILLQYIFLFLIVLFKINFYIFL